MKSEEPPQPFITSLPVYLISLPERREAALSRLRALGWSDITVMPSVPEGHPEGVDRGHGEALEAARERGVLPFIIMEDDAHATEDWRPLRLPPPSCGADALYLFQEREGARRNDWGTRSRWEDAGGEWVRVINMLGLYAVVVLTETWAEAYHEVCMAAYRWKMCMDLPLVQLMRTFRVLGLRRPLIYQGPYETNRNAAGSRLRLPHRPIGREGGKIIHGWE